MGHVKSLLLENPFSVTESMWSLSKRLLAEVDMDLSYPDCPEDYERDLIRLRTALKEIIEHENLNSRVQQS